TVGAVVYIDQLHAVNQANSGSFTIDAPVVTVISPNGGETWYRGNTYTIKWSSNMTQQQVDIYLYKGGSLSSAITYDTQNDGLYDWPIPSGQAIGTDYRIKIVSDDGTKDSSDAYFTIAKPEEGIREIANLVAQNLKLEIYPNPFSGKTVIRYSLNGNRNDYTINDLRLTIYDLTGRLVKSFPLLDSRYSILNSVTWDGTDASGNRLPSGIYFCKLQIGDESLTKQLLLLR
ncbi:MAG: Ser-Thr-rich GPI-anchored membrane family protein, partial [bacterium]|nr:Ser-Thr-rich GPI-anchored membrane family protein [bacterium]